MIGREHCNKFGFARRVRSFLGEHPDAFDAVIVQGYGLAALAANRTARVPVFMLVCSPVEEYMITIW